MTARPPLRLAVPASLGAVARATEALALELPAQLPVEDRNLLLVAVAEVLTNIVEHGYGGQGGPPIDLRCWQEPGQLWLEVRDQGTPIPEARLAPEGADATFDYDPDDLARLPERGLGLAIIKSTFDRVEYRSDSGCNCLRLGKRLPA